jgi:MFS family permease
MNATHQRGMVSIFGSTFFELVGYFMLTPWLLLRLADLDTPTALAGLFAASGWLGVFLMTPFASAVTQRLGRRPTLWLAAAVPVVGGIVFGLTEWLLLWFVLKLGMGMATGLRWVLAEAVVAELSPPGQRGRYVGIFETMVGATFVIGPLLLAWIGPSSTEALWVAVAFLALGLAWSCLIPRLPEARDTGSTQVGLRGVWHALLAHPVIMLAGFVGGFFESGITSMLPLYGLALGLGAAAAALLVSASGLGSALLMLPAGMLADRLGRRGRNGLHHPFWGHPAQTRLQLMRVAAALTLLITLLVPFISAHPALAWPVVFLWGGVGGSLYTLAMIDIGSRESGITLVNSTAVLVMSYTAGGVLAPALGASALQWAPVFGFPALLIVIASAGLWRLMRARVNGTL